MTRMSRLTNAVPSLVLRSPWHRLMSGRYAVLEFTGRTTGRTFRTPVAYVQDGSRVLMSTDSGWWRNLVHGPDVRLRLRGCEVHGTARVVDDRAEAVDVLDELVHRVPGYARPAGLAATRGEVPVSELERAVAEGRRSIEISLVGAP
jgi:deazaflavin-dependent oxidoreductase (nitroreductase family)